MELTLSDSLDRIELEQRLKTARARRAAALAATEQPRQEVMPAQGTLAASASMRAGLRPSDLLDPIAEEPLGARAHRAAAQAGTEPAADGSAAWDPPMATGQRAEPAACCLDPIALEQRVNEARARGAAAEIGTKPTGADMPSAPEPARSPTLSIEALVGPLLRESAVGRRRRQSASLVCLFLVGLCVGAFSAALAVLAPMRSGIAALIASEAPPEPLVWIVESPTSAPSPTAKPGEPALARFRAAPQVPAKPQGPLADAPATLMATLPSGRPPVTGVPPLAGPAVPVPVAAPAPTAGRSRVPGLEGLTVPSTESAPPPASAPDETVLAALLPAAAPAADAASPRTPDPASPGLAAQVVLSYPPSARDVAGVAQPPAKPQAPVADAPASLMATLPSGPPPVTGVPPLAGPAVSVPVAAPPPTAGRSRVPEPAGLTAPGTEPAPPPASAPDETVLAALLPGAAPAADAALPPAPYRVSPGLPAHVVLHYPPSARDVANAAIAALVAAGVTNAVTVQVSFEVPSTDVRFFHAADQAAADGIASVLAGGVAGAAPKARDFTRFLPQPASGRLEVWLAGARS